MTAASVLSDHPCECGCGNFTFLAPKTNAAWGHVKGQPLAFLRGHKPRLVPEEGYVEELGPFVSPCWIWQRATNSKGYGLLSLGDGHRTLALAHRWFFEHAAGQSIPDGLEVHHICERKLCVNPAHLGLVTRLQHRNLRRREAA